MVENSQFQTRSDYTKTVTIADGEQLSGAIDLQGMRLCGVILPSGFDGTTLSVYASDAIDGTYHLIQDASADIEFTVAASRAVAFKDQFASMFPWQYIKLNAGTSQTGDVDITLALTAV